MYDKKKNTSRRPHEEKQCAEPYSGAIGGRNAVKELLASGRDVDKIFVARGDREGSILKLIGEARGHNIPVIETERRKLDDILGDGNHQGIVALASEKKYSTIDEMLEYAASRNEAPLLVLLDGVEDPHNLGAIIRNAECAGAHGVIIPKRRASGLTAVVAKSSAGAIEHMMIAKVTNLSETIRDLKDKGLWVYAADMDGTSYYDTDLTGPAVIVLGSEGSGISRLVEENCDFRVSIPLYGSVNSMNVSAAGAVILCEAARQRHKNQ